MCGIVYIRGGHDGIVDKLLKHYQKQRGRGVEGFGFVATSGDRVVYRRSQFEGDIKTKLEKVRTNKKDVRDILFHHRYPTSTENITEASHPILVSHKELTNDYYVVHNGIISNCDTLKEKHEKLGYEYTTEIETYLRVKYGKRKEYTTGIEYNDSEALAIELARYKEGLQDSIEARGSIAFIMLEVEKGSTRPIALHYGRNEGNPLGVTLDDGHYILASEGDDKIASDIFFTYDYATGMTVSKDVPIGTCNTPSVYTGSSCGFTGSGCAGSYGHGYGYDDRNYADDLEWEYDKDGRKISKMDCSNWIDDVGCAVDDLDDDEWNEAIERIDEIENIADMYKGDELLKYWHDAVKYTEGLKMEANKKGMVTAEWEYIDYLQELDRRINVLENGLIAVDIPF